MRVPLVVVVLLLLAGCLSKPLGPTDGQETGGNVRPEMFYLSPTGDSLDPQPDAMGMEGWGFLVGGSNCDASVHVLVDPCWSGSYRGWGIQDHAIGDRVELHLWMQSAAPSPTPTSLHILLESKSETVANLTVAVPFGPRAPGTPAPGADGCFEVTIMGPLTANIVAHKSLDLMVRMQGFVGTDCFGGGETGSRLVLGGTA